MKLHSVVSGRPFVLAAVVGLLLLPTAGADARQTNPSGVVSSGKAQTIGMSAGTRVVANWQSKPPVATAAQRATMEAGLARSHRPGPDFRPGSVQSSAALGAPVSSPNDSTKASAATGQADPPSTMELFRNTVVPFSGISGGSSYVSNTQEPSIDANGKNIFQTGNWYATRSFNNGASWSYLNPFTIFGSGFCCDQVTIYEPGRDLQFWLLQYDNHLVLALSQGSSLFNSWCYYTLTAPYFGGSPSSEIDYNDMVFGTDYIYVASNVYTSDGFFERTGILRLPIDSLASCGGWSGGFVSVNDRFTFKPVQGATNTMYWGSDGGGTLGTSFRLYSWAENSGTYFWYDRNVAPFVYMVRNGGQYCGGSGIANWCQFADSRVTGGWLVKGILGWSFNAKQDGSHPYPFTRVVKFSEASKAYLGATDFWSGSFAVQFMAWAPNARGDLGGTFAFGGGTWFPGTGMFVQDNFPTSFRYITSNSNACTYGGLYRWGDFLTVRPYHPAGLVWITATMRNINGGPCALGGYSEVRNVVFGRQRDAGSVTRWQNV